MKILRNWIVPLGFLYGMGSIIYFIINGTSGLEYIINEEFWGLSIRYVFGFAGLILLVVMFFFYFNKLGELEYSNKDDLFIILNELWSDSTAFGKIIFILVGFCMAWGFYILIDVGW